MSYNRECSSLAKDGRIIIRIDGEPQPFPKKEVKKRGNRMVPTDRDYRERKHPLTGQKIKYDIGYKRRWMKSVTDGVEEFMLDHKMHPFIKNHPMAIGMLFFLTKAKSCKLPFPSQDPDKDNLGYAINNALKMTPKKKGLPGRYPKGILFYEDNQPIWTLAPDGMFWADANNAPGLIITACSVYDILPEIEKYVNPSTSYALLK